MPYDQELASRYRDLLPDGLAFEERTMFGGRAFLVGGNMAIAASGRGGVLVRAEPEEVDHLLDSTPAEVAVMGGRPMTGWLRVPAGAVADDSDLRRWVRIGTDRARSLPRKTTG